MPWGGADQSLCGVQDASVQLWSTLLNLTTYGDSPAAQTLTRLLEEIPDEKERKKTIQKLGTLWMDHVEAMLELQNVKRGKVRRRFLYLSWDETRKSLANTYVGHDKRAMDIKTYFLNVCTARHREALQWEKDHGQDQSR